MHKSNKLTHNQGDRARAPQKSKAPTGQPGQFVATLSSNRITDTAVFKTKKWTVTATAVQTVRARPVPLLVQSAHIEKRARARDG